MPDLTPATRTLLTAGVVGSPLFIVTTVTQELTRDGFGSLVAKPRYICGTTVERDIGRAGHRSSGN